MLLKCFKKYNRRMEPFDFYKNKDEITNAVNRHIKIAGLTDPDGFTLLEGFVAPVIYKTIEDYLPLQGRLLPQVAVIGNRSGVIYYFYLDTLFPGRNLG